MEKHRCKCFQSFYFGVAVCTTWCVVVQAIPVEINSINNKIDFFLTLQNFTLIKGKTHT